jgi:hypothetical protein
MTMKKRADIILVGLSLFFLIAVPLVRSQQDAQNLDELKKAAPKVFLDGTRLDIDYIRTEITFVNYVRDRKEADVHVLITQQRTGGGGREYTITFIGLNTYEDLKNVLKFYSNRTETEDEIRKGLVQILKLGLAPYAARTPIHKILSLDINGKVKPTSVVDKWDFWVFSFASRGRLSGEQSRKYTSIFGNVSINRVTPESRLRMGFSASLDESEFDSETEEGIYYKEKSSTKSGAFDGLYVKSLGEHWSAGAFVNLGHSTYSNINFGSTVAPAVEYNFFPYSISTRRQLRVLYRIGYNYSKYIEETLREKKIDSLLNEILTITLSLSEPWGNAELSVEGSNYFLKKFRYNRLRISSNLSLRIWKGLALTIDGRYAVINDQLALRKSEVSVEELLLRRRELPTEFNYSISIGFSYTFGSVYSNVVNPRFGGGFGGPGGSRDYGF